MFYKNKVFVKLFIKKNTLKIKIKLTCLDKLFLKINFLFWFYKNIINSIYITLIKFNWSLIENKNNFVLQRNSKEIFFSKTWIVYIIIKSSIIFLIKNILFYYMLET